MVDKTNHRLAFCLHLLWVLDLLRLGLAQSLTSTGMLFLQEGIFNANETLPLVKDWP